MWPRDYRDIIGGGVLAVLGILTAYYSLTELRLGTASRMGPGFYPAALGVILTFLGVGILGPAMFRNGMKLSVDMRSLLAICAATAAFAVIVRPFGLIPGILFLTLIASRADSKLSFIKVVFLAIVLSLGSTLIFRVGLGVQLSPFNWPW